MLLAILIMLIEFIYSINSIPCSTMTTLYFQNNHQVSFYKQIAQTTNLPIVKFSKTTSSIH